MTSARAPVPGRDAESELAVGTGGEPELVSIVVPVYNSAAILPELVREIEAAFAGGPWHPELILVNDGSRDDSWAAVCEAVAARPWVRGLDLARNFGQHNALLCGIRAARGAVTVTIDDDLQHPPAEIPKLLAALDERWDVVYGTPAHERHGLWRDLASRMTKLALQSAMGVRAARDVSALRAFRTDLRRSFANYDGDFVAVDVLLTWGTTRFTSVRVRHDARRSGVSNYTFLKLVKHAITLATGFSVRPLQLASLTGFAFVLFGFLVLAWVIVRYLVEGGSVAGFPFLASIIALFSGSQLFALGIIGEYLARIHTRSMEKPTYVVRREARAGGHALPEE